MEPESTLLTFLDCGLRHNDGGIALTRHSGLRAGIQVLECSGLRRPPQWRKNYQRLRSG